MPGREGIDNSLLFVGFESLNGYLFDIDHIVSVQSSVTADAQRAILW